MTGAERNSNGGKISRGGKDQPESGLTDILPCTDSRFTLTDQFNNTCKHGGYTAIICAAEQQLDGNNISVSQEKAIADHKVVGVFFLII